MVTPQAQQRNNTSPFIVLARRIRKQNPPIILLAVDVKSRYLLQLQFDVATDFDIASQA